MYQNLWNYQPTPETQDPIQPSHDSHQPVKHSLQIENEDIEKFLNSSPLLP